MTTVTATTKAWLNSCSDVTPQQLANPKPAVIDQIFYANHDMKSVGWTLIGEANITITFINQDELIGNKVAALRAEAVNIRAEATAKCTRIEDQINQLLCLEFTPAGEVQS